MTDEPTAWQDINPPMASAAPPVPRSASLVPTDRRTFRNELAACLALVAPVGMTEEARADWLKVAWHTLKDLPPDLLRLGCAQARRVADHPAKIVPAICAYADERLETRRRLARQAHDERMLALEGPKPVYVTGEEAAEILAQYGLRRRSDEA